MWLLRPLPLLAVVVAGCLAVAGAVTLARGDAPAAPHGPAASVHDRADAGAVRALAALRRWDRGRAAAYAAGDVAALRRLYVRGAPAGREDARVLRAYADRGLRVRGLALQRTEVDVLAVTCRRVQVEVVERLAGAIVVAAGEMVRLPKDRPQRRVVTLVRAPGGWRVASVVPVSAARR